MSDQSVIAQDRGLSLVEIVVALFIASIVGMAAAQQAVQAHQARRTSSYWITATQLAAARMELLRAGDRNHDDATSKRFQFRWSVVPASGYPDLELAQVTVTWKDGGEKTFTLATLIPKDE